VERLRLPRCYAFGNTFVFVLFKTKYRGSLKYTTEKLALSRMRKISDIHVNYLYRTEFNITYKYLNIKFEPSGRAISAVRVQPLVCWDRGFESCRRHRSWPLVFVLCYARRALCDEPTIRSEASTESVSNCVLNRNLKKRRPMRDLGCSAIGEKHIKKRHSNRQKKRKSTKKNMERQRQSWNGLKLAAFDDANE